MGKESSDEQRGKHHPRSLRLLRDELAARRTIAGQVISVAHLMGRPVLDIGGVRVGRVNDVVVRWVTGTSYPRVVALLVRASKGTVLVSVEDLTLLQSKVTIGSSELSVAKPVRHEGDIALARDVLDHQLVDIEGVQVVRAADAYLLRIPDGWELAGVDVGFRAFARRLIPRRRACPTPHRVIDWADLQTFVPRSTEAGQPVPRGPSTSAGEVGSSIQLGSPAREVRRLRAKDVAAIISGLGAREQAQMATLVAPPAAAQALASLKAEQRDALLAELDEGDRARLLRLLQRSSSP